MQEMKDGSFGPIEDARKMFGRMAREGVPADLKTVHLGTRRALERYRERAGKGGTPGSRAKAGRKVAELEGRVHDLEAQLNALRLREDPAADSGEVKVYPAAALAELAALEARRR